ncbi:MAG TPA: SurA N-terminal domain-containing protein [Pyrinomonadaceae bacterium]|nr:SurA N-terminal domain-containing protein [Pyrinomonadaceae bacterium]
MIRKVNIEGVNAIVQKFNFKFLSIALIALAAFVLNACTGGTTATNSGSPTGVDPNETAATVNSKPIKLEEVERVLKQQAQGQEGQLSQLELAAARLQVLQNLIEQEVLFQQAEKEGTIPTDEEVTAEYNKLRTGSNQSQEQFEKLMAQSGATEQSIRDALKKRLAIEKLMDKVASKVEPPRDSEIQNFYESNREAFKNKRGAQLAAIVIDPRDLGQGDTTKSDIEAQQKAKEIGQRLMQGADFATVAREASEDPDTRLRGGDWRYFTEDEMKQVFGDQLTDAVMNKMQNGQIIPSIIPFEGRYLIVKLQRKQERDEDRTLETPGVREEITKYLVDARKQLLSQSYAAAAMNQAKIENLLAQKVVNNPNELSGARPANAAQPPAANTAPNAAANANTANTNSAANTKAETKPEANTKANQSK